MPPDQRFHGYFLSGEGAADLAPNQRYQRYFLFGAEKHFKLFFAARFVWPRPPDKVNSTKQSQHY